MSFYQPPFERCYEVKKPACRPISSLYVHKKLQMITAKRISALIFLTRGWRQHGQCSLIAPIKFKSYLTAAAKNNAIKNSVRIGGYSSIFQDWCKVGAVASREGVHCSRHRQYVILTRGLEILQAAPAELLTEARAIVRAKIWAAIIVERSYRKNVVRIRARVKT